MAKASDRSLIHEVLWRGIQLPGHEACQLWQSDQLWHLDGVALFAHQHSPCRLSYQITCDPGWRTRTAQIRGRVGEKLIDVNIRVEGQQRWWLNEAEVPDVEGSIDLDLNFSPSTNLLPIRRLKLAVGEQARITPAWLRFPSFTLEPLPQRYLRMEESVYRYESGGGKFATELKVDPEGFVVDYPGIWVAEAAI
jgi:hypothetical protein